MISKHLPKVSIGMPVYNGELFICEALDSLLAQTFTDFELIISDNGSTDTTEIICKKYVEKDRRIRYLRQAENKGAISNFKFVLDEAVGEYFMWAAADDVWDHEWINKLLPMVSDGTCIAYGCLWAIDEYGQRISHPANGRTFKYTGIPIVRRMKYFFEPAFMGKANPIYGIFPKKALTDDAFNILKLSSCGSDMLFVFNLLHKLEIKSNEFVHLNKRIHGGCAGGGVNKAISNKRSLIYRFVHFFSQTLIYQKNKIADYSFLTKGVEKILLFVIFPFSVAVDIGHAVLNKINNPKKLT